VRRHLRVDDDNAFFDKSAGLNLVYTWDRFGHGRDLKGAAARRVTSATPTSRRRQSVRRTWTTTTTASRRAA
jgi:hypothetical protein